MSAGFYVFLKQAAFFVSFYRTKKCIMLFLSGRLFFAHFNQAILCSTAHVLKSPFMITICFHCCVTTSTQYMNTYCSGLG